MDRQLTIEPRDRPRLQVIQGPTARSWYAMLDGERCCQKRHRSAAAAIACIRDRIDPRSAPPIIEW